MTVEIKDPIVELIGEAEFDWLSRDFSGETRLKDIPDEILEALASVDITARDYAADRNSLTTIALVTFAHKIAQKRQEPRFGPKDILLVKVLAKSEKARREGRISSSGDPVWETPLFELITGEVGERIRAMRTMNSPL